MPRVLGHYMRDLKVTTGEDALQKMTFLSASNVGISDRGIIRPGLAADLVLFDPKSVGDRATIKHPHALSTGIKTVWVKGESVFDDGGITGRHPGRALRRATQSSPIDESVQAEMARPW